VDKTFGAIVEALKRTGTYNNTLIVYLSDNGAAFPGSKTNVLSGITNSGRRLLTHNALVRADLPQ
jgi:arylsulfatase A-like enzyme